MRSLEKHTHDVCETMFVLENIVSHNIDVHLNVVQEDLIYYVCGSELVQRVFLRNNPNYILILHNIFPRHNNMPYHYL